jgi:Flp pilus assembly protein TadB
MIGLAGIALCAGAVLVAVLYVVAPAGPHIPASRKRPPGTVPVSSLTRVTNALLGGIGRLLNRRGGESPFASKLELAGVRMVPAAYVLLVLCAAIVLGAFGAMLTGLTLLSVPAAIILAALAPIGSNMLLAVRRDRRRGAFAEQLDDTLSLLAGSLRAGHSLLRAVDGVSKEVESPMREELARILNETRIGRDLSEAMNLTAARMRSDDFAWISQAVAINQEAGGNLSDVLDQTGRTIRQRNEIRRQVKALSAEGRMSALVLLLLPVAVLGALLLIRPSYLAPLFTSFFGWAALLLALILMIVGALWMRVAVKVKF